MTGTRPFDLILQGATGFTGHLAAEEIALHAPEGLRWAVAGRDPVRTRAVAQRCGAESVVADGLDPEANRALAESTRTVISCAGPFSRYGKHLVEACVAAGTHYADISGELPWITSMVEQHHAACTVSGTALVPASGFDSVPTDLAVQAMLEEIPADTPLCGFYSIRGGFNGGTLHSGIAMAEDHGPTAVPHATSSGSPFPIPALDRWATPFLMAPVNEATVQCSHRLRTEGTGEDRSPLDYREFMMVRGRFRAYAVRFVLQRVEEMFSSRFGRSLIRRFGPSPGQGPSETAIRDGFARLTLLAGPLDAPIVSRTWSWDGDPGNRITVRCLVQTGLALAAGEALRGGVLTPSTALGAGLMERLESIGAVRTRSA